MASRHALHQTVVGLLRRATTMLMATATIAACQRAPQHAAAPVTIRDHHVHLLGPDVIRDWKSLGVPFSRPDSVYLSPAALLRTRADTTLDVVLVPMAHLYGSYEFVQALRLSPDSARARLRRENAHVANEARRFAGRAVALCSVPARAEWALDELQHCVDSLQSAGIKLHLASSGVHFKRPADVARVAAIAAWAAARDLPMLLHVDTQRDTLDAVDVRYFAEQALAPHPTLRVIVAHLGGSGGYGSRTQTIFRALREWHAEIGSREGTPRPIYFELSAVVLERESEGVPPTTDAEARMLRDDLRTLGMDRLVLGSDYPVFDPVRTLELLRERVGLTHEEVRQIAEGGARPIP